MRQAATVAHALSGKPKNSRKNNFTFWSAQNADANGIIVPGSGAAAEGGAGSTLMETPA